VKVTFQFTKSLRSVQAVHSFRRHFYQNTDTS